MTKKTSYELGRGKGVVTYELREGVFTMGRSHTEMCSNSNALMNISLEVTKGGRGRGEVIQIIQVCDGEGFAC